MNRKNILLTTFTMAVLSASAAEQTFIVTDPGGRNHAEFKSKAPIETISGTTHDVTGWVTFDPDDLSKPTKAEINVDLRTLKTGIETRDNHMRSEQYLDVEKFPFATLKLDGKIDSAKKKLAYDDTTQVSLEGTVTVHGVTREVRVTGTIGYLAEVPALAEYGYAGDMFNFIGGFKIKLADYGIERPQLLLLKLSEEVAIQVDFTATTKRQKE